MKNYVLIALATFIVPLCAQAELKIAVFDNDFTGYENSIGTSLPGHTYFHPGRVKVNLPEYDNLSGGLVHGLTMAEILTKDINSYADFSLHLYEVRGFTNFKEAIDAVIRDRVDIILHSMVRDYGSNFDGQGFVNAEVNRATRAGIIWINAAGNYGKTSYTGNPSKFDKSNNWVTLPGYVNSLPIECAPPKEIKTCHLRLSLSWTSHSNDPNVGTDKDLDMILDDQSLKNFSGFITGDRRQVVGEPKSAKESKYPREIIETDLKPGKYSVRVINHSHNFSADDRFRLASDSLFISFAFHDKDENIFNPADNQNVITVGANDSERSSHSLKLNKPDIKIGSRLILTNGEEISGSSVAAAKAAARAAIVLAQSRGLDKDALVALLDYDDVDHGVAPARPETRTARLPSPQQQAPPTPSARVAPTESPSERTSRQQAVVSRRARSVNLGFTSTSQDCFEEVAMPRQPPYINFALNAGGRIVQTTAGIKIAFEQDPLTIAPYIRRVRSNDMVLATPSGIIIRPREEMSVVPGTWAELFQLPPEVPICD